VTVVIVDPHTKLRAALVAVLAADAGITVIGAVGTFDEALAVVRLRRPRVALVDIAALGHRGVAGLAELRAARSRTAILVMGVVDDPALEHAAIRYGAVGRVLKDMTGAELAAAVRNAARRPPRLRIVPPEA
jgi:DNA-binding NarL/FixJ family response regulator